MAQQQQPQQNQQQQQQQQPAQQAKQAPQQPAQQAKQAPQQPHQPGPMQVLEALDVARMREAASFFLGDHDFRNFCKVRGLFGGAMLCCLWRWWRAQLKEGDKPASALG